MEMLRPSLVLIFASIVFQPPILTAAPEAYEVSATRAGELPGGKEADGIIGDFILRNDRVEAEIGAIDILVNNAGIIRRADALEFSEADWDAVMDTNLKVVFFLTQAFARQALKQGPVDGVAGKVINIASLLSFQGGIRVPSYTASKSGLAGLTKILANEWATKGINVNAIAPGYFDTNNTEALRNDADRNASILARIPAARLGGAIEVRPIMEW